MGTEQIAEDNYKATVRLAEKMAKMGMMLAQEEWKEIKRRIREISAAKDPVKACQENIDNSYINCKRELDVAYANGGLSETEYAKCMNSLNNMKNFNDLPDAATRCATMDELANYTRGLNAKAALGDKNAYNTFANDFKEVLKFPDMARDSRSKNAFLKGMNEKIADAKITSFLKNMDMRINEAKLDIKKTQGRNVLDEMTRSKF
ncbi:MAG: hypothetical protein J5525_12330 [Lachnospiraceae bacterium]|nr:hypothetical protein [Lachnospiraceae bacterium]